MKMTIAKPNANWFLRLSDYSTNQDMTFEYYFLIINFLFYLLDYGLNSSPTVNILS